MNARPFVARNRQLVLVLALTLVGAGAGCRGPGSRHHTGPTQLDRLMAAYPDLSSGRFAVIADFEDPKHMEIFKLISVSPKARCVLGGRRGRAETGRGCIDFTTGSPDDAIVINNDRAANWYLKRDWRDYDLLLLSVRSPKPDLTAEVVISAGPVARPMAVHAEIPLQRGWNLVRLDLAEVGERIPLDDVRDLRFSVSGARKPVKLTLDDIILTGSREDLFGDSQDRSGAMYVQRAGRRWNIGVGGRFELTFANGQIVRWHNLEADPYRVRNLVQGTTLGPSLVIVDRAGGEAADLNPFGGKVIARSRILEMSSVRTVVGCEWRFVGDPEAPLDERLFHRWLYTIYPTGQVYVSVESSAIPAATPTSDLGLAVTLATGRDGDVQTDFQPGRGALGPRAFLPTRPDPDADPRLPIHSDRSSSTESGVSQNPAQTLYASARIPAGDASLLYVPGNQPRLRELVEESDAGRRQVSFTALFDNGAAETESWHCHLLLGTSTEVAPAEVSARATAYARPAGLRFELGSPVPPAQADTGQTGFDPASGCYVITPDQGRVRFVIDGRGQPRFSPAFRVICRPDDEAWVYVNNLILKNIARDASGNLVFQLPGIVRSETTVEILFRRPLTTEQ